MFDLAPTLLPELGARPRDAIDRLADLGFRAVQLSASQPGMRPRDLDRSGRRDLLGRLRRREITPAGLDLWIPETHLTDPEHVDRAVTAILEAMALAGDLGRCPLSLMLPAEEGTSAVIEAVAEQALRQGVPLADHHVPPAQRADIGVGIDPTAWLGRGRDPFAAVEAHAQRLAIARLSDLDDRRLDLMSWRKALQSSGYQGHVVVDVRGWSDPWGELPAAAAAWKAAESGGGLPL